MEKVIDNLVAVLIARSLAVVWTQDADALVRLIQPLWHHDWARLAYRIVLHRGLHAASVLALYAKA